MHLFEVSFELFLIVETLFAAIEAVAVKDVHDFPMVVLLVVGPVGVFGEGLAA